MAMEGLKRGGAVWWTIMAVGMLTFAVCQPPQRHKVGGNLLWTNGVNYTQWAIHERFYAGDWLFFVFDKHAYNVLEVNKTSYENCIDQGFISNITKGGRDVFELKQARPYYFLSGGGYCYNGMKLAIDVEVYVAPALPPAKNNGLMNARPPTFLVIVLVIGLVRLLSKLS